MSNTEADQGFACCEHCEADRPHPVNSHEEACAGDCNGNSIPPGEDTRSGAYGD